MVLSDGMVHFLKIEKTFTKPTKTTFKNFNFLFIESILLAFPNFFKNKFPQVGLGAGMQRQQELCSSPQDSSRKRGGQEKELW